jgi:hypothetical protein
MNEAEMIEAKLSVDRFFEGTAFDYKASDPESDFEYDGFYGWTIGHNIWMTIFFPNEKHGLYIQIEFAVNLYDGYTEDFDLSFRASGESITVMIEKCLGQKDRLNKNRIILMDFIEVMVHINNMIDIDDFAPNNIKYLFSKYGTNFRNIMYDNFEKMFMSKVNK